VKILVTLFTFLVLLVTNTNSVLAATNGDVNSDGKVDIVDIGIIIDSYGRTTCNLNADINRDCKIDIIDIGISIDNYGRTANVPTGSPPPVTASIWISGAEMSSLPTTGTAWANVRSAAYGSWGTPDLKNQDNKFGLPVLAGALVYGKTGDTALRSKVRDAIIAAKRTMDEPAEWQTTNGALSLGRQLGAFVIAADLIDLKSFDSTADSEFRNYLRIIRTQNVGTHGRWKNLTYTCENSANNWGTFACPSRIAAGIYLGDTADITRSANIIRAFLGERQFYPADAPGEGGYFQHTAGGLSGGWSCNESSWTAINPNCSKNGINLDGVLVEDISRGGNCCAIVGDGIGYSWEALQGLYVSAELLHRRGFDAYNWSNKALKRSVDYMYRNSAAWNARHPVADYVIWMSNKRYGSGYPTRPAVTGRIMSWTDWTHN
jgi:hypothetical protein